MSAALVVAILVKLVLAGAVWAILKYRKLWRTELAARIRLHLARIEDNNQRAVDNQRWAERVAQARELAKLAEQPAEHVRNAKALLQSYRETCGGAYGQWEPAELAEMLLAVEARLEKAIYWPNLEGGKSGQL